MKRHTVIYTRHFGYDESDFIPCEVCGERAVDVHHIEARGMGGDPTNSKDVIENLMGLCRKCHDLYGDKEQYMDFLRHKHTQFLQSHEEGDIVNDIFD